MANSAAITVFSSLSTEVQCVLRGHLEKVTCLQWAPDDRFLFSCAQDGRVFRWAVHGGQACVWDVCAVCWGCVVDVRAGWQGCLLDMSAHVGLAFRVAVYGWDACGLCVFCVFGMHVLCVLRGVYAVFVEN